MRGRKPRSDAQKKLSGTYRKGRTKTLNGTIKGEELECPEWLSPTAKAEWARLVPELQTLVPLLSVDQGLVAAFCVNVARLRESEQFIEQQGLTVMNHGSIQRNPAIGIAKEASSLIRTLSAELGLSPSSRERLGIKPPEPPDEFERFLAQ